mgnify:CR=1 FL=1
MQDPRITDFLTSLQLERDASPHTISAYRTDLAELQAFLEARDLVADFVATIEGDNIGHQNGLAITMMTIMIISSVGTSLAMR